MLHQGLPRAPFFELFVGTMTRLAISMAAVNCAALAPFSPLTSSSAITGASTNPFRDPNRLSKSRPNSTALVPLKPTLINMAINSASVRASGPRVKSRSQGRSYSGQDTMPLDLLLIIAIGSNPHRRFLNPLNSFGKG